MHMIVRSTAYPVGDGRTGTPIWDRVKCSKLEDLPTNPSSWHPCPALRWQLTVTLRWSHPVEPRSTAEMESSSGTQEHGCSFLSLTLPQPPAQAVESAECPPPPISHHPLHAQPTHSVTPLQPDQAHLAAHRRAQPPRTSAPSNPTI